ncbi:MAG TPA: type II secretion system F family protein [Trebonia sp.]|nr:type II secretion system F family protein [Trebonia sp.]
MLAVAVMPARPGEGGVAGALAAIEKRYAQGASEAVRENAGLFATLPGWLRALALRLSPSGIVAKLQHRLDLAGNPARWNPDRMLAVKGLGLVMLGASGMLVGAHKPLLLILYSIVGAGIGFFLPDVLLYNAGLKRQERIQAALPDAMDMLTVCVEAGLGFDAALDQVARNTSGPLAAELARALQEMQIGKSRTEALRAMANRTTAPELRAFVSALVQAGDLGISVAGVLREQAKEMRIKRRQRAEEKAQKVPVKILFPLITCLLPVLFVVILGPGVMMIARVFFNK